jgi:hemoglobin
MKNRVRFENSPTQNSRRRVELLQTLIRSSVVVLCIIGFGCGTAKEKKDSDFFTSGSREADQRASQRMAKDEQLSGSGEGAGEKTEKKSRSSREKSDKDTNKVALAVEKLSLFERLGGESGITKIVDDFLPRAMQDPRVNWHRKGVKRGGFSFNRNQPATWNATPEKVAQLKKHFVQFFSLATGGPAHYEGKNMKSAHSSMHISNSEFDAAVGDLKASLDKLQIPNKEQKELLAIAESTRPQIVAER